MLKLRLPVLTVALLSALSALSAGTASAATVTVTGTDFDVTYDPSTLGLFGALNVVGDNLFFTTSSFSASSTNGQGVVTPPTNMNTASGIILTAHAGFHFGTLALNEFGDYVLQGTASSVSVTGQLRAFDYNNPFTTQTFSTITPSGTLTNDNGVANPWAASAAINNAPSSATGWLSGASVVDLTVENLLSAYTAAGTGPQQAFIEKKFNGVEVSVAPVPLPPSLWFLASGLGALVLGVRRQARS